MRPKRHRSYPSPYPRRYRPRRKGSWAQWRLGLLALIFLALAVLSRFSSQVTYYPNCAAARAAGVAPINRGEPGYRHGLDADGDGVACEPYYR
jgi:hypothetical protein